MLNVISKLKQLYSVVAVQIFFSYVFCFGQNQELCAAFLAGDLHFLRENNSKSLMDNRLMFNSSEKSLFFTVSLYFLT